MARHPIPRPGHLYGTYPEKQRLHETPALFAGVIARWQGSAPARAARRRALQRNAARVLSLHSGMPTMPGHALRQLINEARAEMSRDGLESEAALRCMAGVLTCVRAVTGHTLRENQIMAALVVLRGELAEMPTGEGKTLATGLAAATAALAGAPVHVITSNDYLAARDADQLRPLYRLLGLSVSSVAQETKRHARIEAYASNITYCSAKEVVFDYLRDRLAPPPSTLEEASADSEQARVLRGLCMAIIDEADSVLIDEALTPFILSESYAEPSQIKLCGIALHLAGALNEGTHFQRRGPHEFELTDAARARLAERVDTDQHPLWAIPRYREELVTLALSARLRFHRDEHYIVRDGGVHIVDANTGRVSEGRTWSRGLHQMIEIKEGCKPSPATRVIAQISFQRFFPRYLRIGGMSGTLEEARRELLEVYGLPVSVIPPHKPTRLRIHPPRVFVTAEARWTAVVDQIVNIHAGGRPVLIGTDSVRSSDLLSQLLAHRGIGHRVLNARQDSEEAELISHAGRRGAITVATNMAGRGTDIHIARDVAESGGLFVISCQHNSSRRIDRQLYGRAGRQGQPGDAVALLSLEEGLLERWVSPAVRRLARLGLRSDGTLPLIVARALFRRVQQREEVRARHARSVMRAQDDAMQKKMHFGLKAE